MTLIWHLIAYTALSDMGPLPTSVKILLTHKALAQILLFNIGFLHFLDCWESIPLFLQPVHGCPALPLGGRGGALFAMESLTAVTLLRGS